MLRWSEEVPAPPSVSYNNEAAVSSFLNQQTCFNDRPFIALLSADEPLSTEAVGLHAAQLLEHLLEGPIHIHWIACGANETYENVGNSLRALFLSVWADESNIDLSAAEQMVLRFQWRTTLPQDFFEINLSPVYAKIRTTNCIVFLDFRSLRLFDQIRVANILALFTKILSFPSPVRVRPVILVNPGLKPAFERAAENAGLNTSVFDIESPNPATEAMFRSSAQQSRLNALGLRVVKSQSDRSQLTNQQLRFLQILLLLDRPALQGALSMLRDYSSIPTSEFGALVYDEKIVPLMSGGVELASSTREVLQPPSPEDLATGFLHPQVARLLSGTPPQFLAICGSSLKEIEKLLDDQKRILELLAFGISAEEKDATRAYQAAMESLTDESCETWLLNSDHLRTVLTYISQTLLTSNTTAITTLFDLFERITFSFANYLSSSPRQLGATPYEASRWVTNLCYVFDHSQVSQRIHKNRHLVFASAANFLEGVHPRDPFDRASVAYWSGWQLYDAGKSTAAAERFRDGARQLLTAANITIIDELRQQSNAVELIFLALRADQTGVDGILEETLSSYLWKFGPPKLYESLDDVVYRETPLLLEYDHPGTDGKAMTHVVANVFDLHVGLQIAGTFFRYRRSAVHLHILPTNQVSHCERLRLEKVVEDEAVETVLVGSPDTPADAGALALKYEPELARLFQLKLSDHFSHVSYLTGAAKNTYIVSGCGLGSNIASWRQLAPTLLNSETDERIIMEDQIAEPLLRLLSIARGRVLIRYIDKCIAKVESTVGAVARDRLGALKRLLLGCSSGEIDSDDEAGLPAAIIIAMKPISTDTGAAKLFVETASSLRADMELGELRNLLLVGIEAASQIHAATSVTPMHKTTHEAKSHHEAFRIIADEADQLLLDPTGKVSPVTFNELVTRTFQRVHQFGDFVQRLDERGGSTEK